MLSAVAFANDPESLCCNGGELVRLILRNWEMCVKIAFMSQETNSSQFSPDIEKLKGDYPDLHIPHEEMRDLLKLAVEFEQNESPLRGEYLRNQFSEFRESVSTIEGYLGVCGTGHPFYARKEDGGVYGIREYQRHIGEALQMNDWDIQGAVGAWACAACHEEYRLPDLKKFCKPCEVVELKPREVFKRLPDLDFWVVVNHNSEDIEQKVESAIKEADFYTSDEAIFPAVDRSSKVMQSINRGEYPIERLPIDLHIVEKPELLRAIREVPQGLSGDGFIPITPRSLRVGWEQADSPYNFLKDFLFSFEANDWSDDELIGSLTQSRAFAKEYFTESGISIVDYVASLAPAQARQLETGSIAENLKQRIQSW